MITMMGVWVARGEKEEIGDGAGASSASDSIAHFSLQTRQGHDTQSQA